MDFIQEIKEELQQERMLRFFAKYGKIIGLVLIGIILFTALVTWYNNYQFNKRAKDGHAFYQTVSSALKNNDDQDKREKAIATLNELSQSGSYGYKQLAKFRQASFLSQNGDKAKAFRIYEDMYETINDQGLRELAGLYSTMVVLDKPSVAFPEDMIKRLKELSQPEKPWKILATEMLLAYAASSKNQTMVTEFYNKLMSYPELPKAVQDRIQAFAPKITTTNSQETANSAVEK